MQTRSRFAALLRGVSPQNMKMPELKKAFEQSGFEDVKTVLSSGNVVFLARPSSLAALEKRFKREFLTFVQSIELLRQVLEEDPYRSFKLAPQSKRVVTFLREPPDEMPRLPIERDGASILKYDGKLVYSAYVPSPRGPVFMKLIENTFGRNVTTRTWDTIRKLAR